MRLKRSNPLLLSVLAFLLWSGIVVLFVLRGEPLVNDGLAEARGSAKGVRVLFIGNSLTYSNDMPQMVRQLAAAAGELPLLAVLEAPGGYTLAEHIHAGRVEKLLAEVRWDYVVLQEQGLQFALAPEEVAKYADSAVRYLDYEIKAAGAKPVLFLTWGRKIGDPTTFPGDSYEAMQERLNARQLAIAAELGMAVAPVGLAWGRLRREHPTLELWADEIHPNNQGSYLAACVFYALLYGKDPRGNTYTATMTAEEARLLQQAAAAVSEK